jgi:hypothetical protein
MARPAPIEPRPGAAPPASGRGHAARSRRWARRAAWAGGILLGLLLVAYVGASLAEEPLRRTIEREMNRRLDGYTVEVGGLGIHPLAFALDLQDVVIVQDAYPAPPVARIPRLHASLHWRALFHGAIVADFAFDRPRLHVDVDHLRAEAKDDVPVQERGWQEALRAAYFDLEINELRVTEGELTYVERRQSRPLHLGQIALRAANIRNIESRERVYPSELRLEAVVFGTGRLRVDGRADFLAEPHAGVRAAIVLEDIVLDQLAPVVDRVNLAISAGVLSARGTLEYAPGVKVAQLEEATVRGARIDYVHTRRTAAAERRTARTVGKAAEATTRQEDLLVRIDRLQVIDSQFGFVNRAESPDYRVFLADTDLTITNLSNRRQEGTAVAELRGKFMGTGTARARARFRPAPDGQDFDLAAKIEHTELKGMNNLLRAHAKLDVTAGQFFLYSELRVKGREIRGYVKPIFRDVNVYDPEQEKGKGFLQKAYERLVEALSKILENPREDVATKADVFGRVEDPEASTWQIVVRLVQNAFFDAILPGLERQARE